MSKDTDAIVDDINTTFKFKNNSVEKTKKKIG